ncbi:MAG: hypothetical protein NUV80_05590 [Candidatus Berkelbacteria bacterium]|nr:hypothetical protein [Candidatus Berkelbacteria bacterium]
MLVELGTVEIEASTSSPAEKLPVKVEQAISAEQQQLQLGKTQFQTQAVGKLIVAIQANAENMTGNEQKGLLFSYSASRTKPCFIQMSQLMSGFKYGIKEQILAKDFVVDLTLIDVNRSSIEGPYGELYLAEIRCLIGSKCVQESSSSIMEGKYLPAENRTTDTLELSFFSKTVAHALLEHFQESASECLH